MARRNVSVLMDIDGRQICVCSESAKEFFEKVDKLPLDSLAWVTLTNLNGGREIRLRRDLVERVTQIVEAQADIPTAGDIALARMVPATGQPGQPDPFSRV